MDYPRSLQRLTRDLRWLTGDVGHLAPGDWGTVRHAGTIDQAYMHLRKAVEFLELSLTNYKGADDGDTE